MTGLEAFAYALGGGFAISLLDFAALTRTPEIDRPATFTDRAYLAKFFGHPVIGGFLGFVLNSSIDELTPVIAAIAGASAPSVWRAFARTGLGMLRGVIQEFSSVDDEDR